jgi:ATP-dependent Clp protease ATP-binding subunit ClpA
MLSPELEIVLSVAFTHATQRQQEYVTCEHLLLALTYDEAAAKVLKACGADIAALRKQLDEFLKEQFPAGEGEVRPQMTLAVHRILQRASVHVQSSGRQTVTCPDVLVALFSEKDSHAVHFLEQQDVHRLDVVTYLAHGVSKKEVEDDESFEVEMEVSDDEEGGEGAGKLTDFTILLTQRAREGKLDPVIGREKELERVIHILCRRNKNNPLLVGDAGVGKTAVIYALAQRIADGKVPEPLQGAEIFALDLGSLIAGTKYRGQFEERIKMLLNEMKKHEKAVLFIDEIHNIVGAGAVSGGTLDASNLLKMPLSSGELHCIGATTYEEFKNAMERDKALLRRFQKVEVAEPSLEDTVKILHGLKSHFEKFHGVTYTPMAIRAAAELGAKYLKDRRLPDKAIDILDEAGAAQRLLPAEKRKKSIGPKDIETIVSKMARVPVASVGGQESEKLKNLERNLKLVVFGQDDAVHAAVGAIKLSRSGLGSPQKPVGSFLFAGPTGVGKTELAKQLARLMGVEFIRFDMSEYMEKHTVSRLIGAPPGYVGFDQGGLLTDAVIRNPHAVLLLDEIEKAHMDLFAILLQVMDHATLTDNNGRKADFRNVILIMTTNAGAAEMFRKGVGIGSQHEMPDAARGEPRKELERLFTPEFRNRLDAIVYFKALPFSVVVGIVDKFMTELQAQLDTKKVVLDIQRDAVEWLARKGYDKNFGARPLERLIQREVRKPLADEILFGKLARGGKATARIEGDKLVFEYDEKPPSGSSSKEKTTETVSS